GRRAEAHRRQAARSDERSGNAEWILLADAVLVPADVGDDEGIVGQRFFQLGENALRAHRVLIRRPLMGPVLRERPPGARDLVAQRTAAARLSACLGR